LICIFTYNEPAQITNIKTGGLIINILLIGNGNSIYISELALNLKKNHNVDLLTHRKNIPKKERSNFDDIIVIEEESSIIKSIFITNVIKYYKMQKIISGLKRYDIINILYVYKKYNLFIRSMRKKTKSIISSVFGSDFYRSVDKTRKIQKKIYKYSDFITFTNPNTIDDFISFYGKNFEEKSKVCRFGLTPLESLKKTPNKAECVREFHLDPYKLKVAIGYSATSGHQHKEILNTLKGYPKLRKRCQFIIPLTYGDANYRNTLKDYIEKEHKEDDIIILENFLSMDEVAKLRKATDIMINTQITDQFSGSMQETLFANNIVINGSWLPYGLLKERGIYFEEVDKIEEIPDKLEYIIDNYDHLKVKCERNPEIIWELSSWEKNIESWLELYEKALERKK